MDLPPSEVEDINLSDDVCPTCYNLDTSLIVQLNLYVYRNDEEIEVKVSPESLQSSVCRCESCRVLWKGITINFAKIRREPGRIVELRLRFFSGRALRVVAVMDQEDWDGIFDLEFYTMEDETPVWSAFGIGSEAPAVLDADVCVQNLKTWLGTCFEDHSDCRQERPFHPPGRLLDLSSFSRGHIRLVNSSQMEEIRYVALSHCWGATQPKTTTRANLHEHGVQIPVHDLPNTFREAAIITVGLDIRYLWIDSLCIVQDDLGDWETESAKMAAVYGLSYVTIAVLHSPDSHGGCFLTRYWRHPLWRWPDDVPVQNGSIPITTQRGDTVSTVMTRVALTSAHENFFGLPEMDAPLQKRAWALQERLLAPRTLLIYPEELVWECRTTASCECRGLHMDRDTGSSIYAQQIGELKAMIQPRQNLTVTEAARNWLLIISAYSTLRLTKYSDTLPALSGLATHFSQFMKSEYMGGLWSGDFPRSLLWRGRQQMESADDSLPSWSWTAAHSGLVSIAGITYDNSFLQGDFAADCNFNFVSFAMPLSSLSSFASCLGGTLSVTGVMVEISNLLHTKPSNIFQRKPVYGRNAYLFSNDYHIDAIEADEVWQCFLLGSTRTDSRTHFLVLRPSGQPATYRRVGVLNVGRNNERDDLLARAEKVTIDII
ncbi:hypothetical protein ONS95_009050 [Cadophora gregata]|uniref:uncharacterized protein n=1 Tax=Cadophora gregata TaxID=51156 RepID=UPI0026DB02D9|nr:uncharacterized protein ONS95_009050 [Cadophora gregata]KAK0124064.1 hypothetical protein ONS95_009050 [Cadophora gregata]